MWLMKTCYYCGADIEWSDQAVLPDDPYKTGDRFPGGTCGGCHVSVVAPIIAEIEAA